MITRDLDNIHSSCATHRQKKFSVHRPYTPPYRLISQHPFATPPPSKTSSSCTSNTLHPHLIPHYATTSPIFHSPPPSIITHTAASLPIAQNPPIQNPITNKYKSRSPASLQTPTPPTKSAQSQERLLTPQHHSARPLPPSRTRAPATSNSSSTASPGPPTTLDILQRIPPTPPSPTPAGHLGPSSPLNPTPTIQLVRSQNTHYPRTHLARSDFHRVALKPGARGLVIALRDASGGGMRVFLCLGRGGDGESAYLSSLGGGGGSSGVATNTILEDAWAGGE